MRDPRSGGAVRAVRVRDAGLVSRGARRAGFPLLAMSESEHALPIDAVARANGVRLTRLIALPFEQPHHS